MMQYVLVLLTASAICLSTAEKAEDPNAYVDKVLSDYLPSAIKEAGLGVYKMPDFEHNLQNRTADGSSVNTKIRYHSGNLTGFENARRKNCSEPTWSSGNITFSCTLVLPKIKVMYAFQFQELTGYSNNVRFVQRDSHLEATSLDSEITIRVTSSPQLKVPTIKGLYTAKEGKPTIIFHLIQSEYIASISAHFYRKCYIIGNRLLAGEYLNAYQTAFGSVSYPTEG